jgi:hypothetical protein
MANSLSKQLYIAGLNSVNFVINSSVAEWLPFSKHIYRCIRGSTERYLI